MMILKKLIFTAVILVSAFVFSLSAAMAGLDLQNQKYIEIDDMDLNHDKRLVRTEVAEYLFYYFDRDGNESLDRIEYRRERELSFKPNEDSVLRMIDLDNDGFDDDVVYTNESFFKEAMIGDYDPDELPIDAKYFMDVSFLRLDTDHSRAIELDEWQKIYGKYAVVKPNAPPKAANQDRYN